MKIEPLLSDLFPAGHSVQSTAGVLMGFAEVDGREIAVLGTRDALAVGAAAALKLADFILALVEERPGCPLLMLVDTQGQQLSKQQELLGLNGYLAHVVKCLELARRNGHRLLTLAYGEAVSGGFLSFGLMADEIHALPEAKIRVMNLAAMARITKLPLQMLEELSATSPTFAPGVENFHRLGGVQSVWSLPYREELGRALKRQSGGDRRRADGLQRSGRTLAFPVSQRVRDEGC